MTTTYHIRLKQARRKITVTLRADHFDTALQHARRWIGRPGAALHDWSQRCAHHHADTRQCQRYSKQALCWQHRA